MLRTTRLTAADLVSLSRVALAGAFVVSSGTVARLTLIGVAGLTDYADGWLARRGPAGPFGAVIDPASDRFFALVVVATLVVEGVLTIAQCLVLMARDIATTLGALIVLIVPRLRPPRLEARWSGKVVTALQFVTLMAVLIAPRSLRVLLPVVAVASAISIADYAIAIWRGRAAP